MSNHALVSGKLHSEVRILPQGDAQWADSHQASIARSLLAIQFLVYLHLGDFSVPEGSPPLPEPQGHACGSAEVPGLIDRTKSSIVEPAEIVVDGQGVVVLSIRIHEGLGESEGHCAIVRVRSRLYEQYLLRLGEENATSYPEG